MIPEDFGGMGGPNVVSGGDSPDDDEPQTLITDAMREAPALVGDEVRGNTSGTHYYVIGISLGGNGKPTKKSETLYMVRRKSGYGEGDVSNISAENTTLVKRASREERRELLLRLLGRYRDEGFEFEIDLPAPPAFRHIAGSLNWRGPHDPPTEGTRALVVIEDGGVVSWPHEVKVAEAKERDGMKPHRWEYAGGYLSLDDAIAWAEFDLTSIKEITS